MKPRFESIKSVCPVYVATERGRPELLGSATLIEFGKARFLVTAAHVHDGSRNPAAQLYTMGPSHLLPLPKEFVKTSLPASGKRQDDKQDFAFARLDGGLADELAKRHYFLPFDLIEIEDRPGSGAFYMFSGYPRSREKTNYGKKALMPRLRTLVDEAALPVDLAAQGFDPEIHIGMRFRPSDVTDEEGQPQHFPSPKGMSGGAVWRGIGHPREWLIKTNVSLVGIGIEDRPSVGLMIGLRIHVITALIAELNPDLRQFVPTRAGLQYLAILGTDERAKATQAQSCPTATGT